MNIVKLINLRTAGATALAGAAIFAQPAMAQTAGSNLGASAEVTANCAVTSTAIDFGNVDVTTGAAVLGTGGISVVCTNGTAWAASADVGTGAAATLAVRQLSDGANTLNYALFTEATRTTIWGDGTTTTSTIDDIGTGVAQDKIIYGSIAAAQTGAVAGSYADTVAVTVTY
ncbi:spore coat U domain-containing protein [Sphingomonas sp. S1-29]|uniref:Csu type fimbrial protein n=1 Tax=Sphingomonas sp. S1-29 TaxID=2991074 RepID=UPI002240BA4E|nr:spore coat U domain-containing protein [Sphingomonas sp. S1-29]UZK69056.1 spore coat U domain-containing protein [Sphingomonas sp. S1-29]